MQSHFRDSALASSCPEIAFMAISLVVLLRKTRIFLRKMDGRPCPSRQFLSILDRNWLERFYRIDCDVVAFECASGRPAVRCFAQLVEQTIYPPGFVFAGSVKPDAVRRHPDNF